MTLQSSVLRRLDVPQRNRTTSLFLRSSAKKPRQKPLRRNQSPQNPPAGVPLGNRANAVSLEAASTDRRSRWLTPHEKSSSFPNCTFETRSVQSRTLPLNPFPLSPLSPFLSVQRVDASPRGTGIIPVPIFVYTPCNSCLNSRRLLSSTCAAKDPGHFRSRTFPDAVSIPDQCRNFRRGDSGCRLHRRMAHGLCSSGDTVVVGPGFRIRNSGHRTHADSSDHLHGLTL